MADLIRLELVVPEASTDVVTGLLFRLVSFGWEEESLATGETRFRIHCDNAELVHTVRHHVCAVAPDALCEQSNVPDQDWTAAWREFFTPVCCGRFVVLPPWLVSEVENFAPRLPIVIEPKSAFGTGHHNTTVLCLEAISHLAGAGRLTPGMRFIDVGTGSGVLGIGCALLGMEGIGSDIDPIAVDNALENAVINRVEKAFTVRSGSADAGEGQRFDLVLANILAGPLKDMAPDLMGLMQPGGCLVLSGLLDVQANDVEAAYAKLGPATRFTSSDWVALVWEGKME